MAAIPENPRAKRLRKQAQRQAASRITHNRMNTVSALVQRHPFPAAVCIGLFCVQTVFVGILACAWQWFVAYGDMPSFSKIPVATWGLIYLLPYLIALSVIIFVPLRVALRYLRDNVWSERDPSGCCLPMFIGYVLFVVGVPRFVSGGWAEAGVWLAISFACVLMGVVEGAWGLQYGTGLITILVTFLVGKFAAFLAAELHLIGSHLAIMSLADFMRPDLPFVVGLQQALLQADPFSRALLLRAHGAAAAGVVLYILSLLYAEHVDRYLSEGFPRTFRRWFWWSVVHASAMWLLLSFLICMFSARLFLP